MKIIEECQKISGLSDGTLKEILNGKVGNDPNIPIQLQCIAEKIGLQKQQQFPPAPNGFFQQLINRGSEAFGYLVKQCIFVFWGPQLDLVELVQCLYTEFPNALTTKRTPSVNSELVV